MRKITFFNEKGGEGKTTTSCHYAASLCENKKRVIFIDSCKQANSSGFFKKHLSQQYTALDFFTKPMTSIENQDIVCLNGSTIKINLQNIKPHIIKNNLNVFEKAGFDYVIFDTSPAISSITIAILFASDGLFCPAHLHKFSYRAIEKTIDNIAKSNLRNKVSTKFLGIIPNRVSPGSEEQKKELGKLIINYKNKILPPLINRKPYSDAMNNDIPIWKIKPQAGNVKTASLEMKRLTSAIDNVIQAELT